MVQKFNYEHVRNLSGAVSSIEQEMKQLFVWEEKEVFAHKAAKKTGFSLEDQKKHIPLQPQSRKQLSWQSITLPRLGSRVRVPFFALVRSNGGMVDTKDLKSFGYCSCGGSSPPSGTKKTSCKITGRFLFLILSLKTEFHTGKITSGQRRTVNIRGIPFCSFIQIFLISIENILYSCI